MTVTLISGSMLFATLLMGYVVYRGSAAQWPPLGVGEVSLALPVLSTLLIALSSWFCWETRRAVELKDFSKARLSLAITAGLGVAFMLAQTGLWYYLKSVGLYVSSGIFASILYAFTWIHAAHVILGLGALAYWAWCLRVPDQRILSLSINLERFWHFLGVVWFVLFLALFVF